MAQDTVTPMTPVTYLTLQVTGRDGFLQDEPREYSASFLADWGEKSSALQDTRVFECIPDLNHPDNF